MPLVLSLTLGPGVLLVYLSATSGGDAERATRRGESLAARLDEFLAAGRRRGRRRRGTSCC